MDPYGQYQQQQQYQQYPQQYPQQYQQPPCLQPVQPRMPPCAMPVQQPMCPAAAAMQQDMNPPGCYQEIGAEMGGNALKIRVHKEPQASSCMCGSEAPTTTMHPIQAGSSACPGPASPDCPMVPQSMNMTPGSQNAKPFEFKIAGCPGGAGNNVTVVPPVATLPDGTQVTELSDPNRDVFILRIGKKSEGVCKKNNLELELCTPKGPDYKPAPKKETRDSQVDEKELANNDGGKKGKKDKKGKGGKDKKGKGGKGKGGKGGKKGKKK